MNQDELYQSLSLVNVSLTNFQKHVVGLIGRLQNERFTMNNRTEELKSQYDNANLELQQILTNLRSQSAVMLQPAPATVGLAVPTLQAKPNLGGPSLVPAASEAMRQAAAAPGATVPLSPARRRLAQQTDELAIAMLADKVGENFVDGLQRYRADRMQDEAAEATGAPTLARAGLDPAAPIAPASAAPVADPDGLPLDPSALERIKNQLLELLYSARGVIAKWFSNETYGEGHGGFKPVMDHNLYTEDIGKLPYERLTSWPEGFYTNRITKAYQCLVKTQTIVAVIDFGLLTASTVAERQQGVQVMFHTDVANAHRRYNASHLEVKLLHSVISDLEETFRSRATAGI